ncbi:FAD dependent oxidoreductase [Nemania diffusa]|nr:FAD dependent oxidoreductase [Nemania diffusa]
MSWQTHSGTRSFWQSDGQNAYADFNIGTVDLPPSCEVLIVGGGYAGISTAYHLLKLDRPPSSVVLLEAREACSGATGRNGGHLRTDYYSGAASSLERYGPAAASEVVHFEASHLDVIKSVTEKEAIACDFEESSSFAIFTTSEQALAARKTYENLTQVSSLHDLFQKEVQLYIGDEAPEHTGVIEAKGYWATRAAHLSPYKLVTALLARCVDLGLSFIPRTAVTSFDSDSLAGHIVTTSSGQKIKAEKIIFATNAYTSALLPEYSTSIIPCKGLACHITAPEGKTLPKLPTSSYAVSVQDPISRATGSNYMVQLADNSIVVGGAHHTYQANLESWYNNTDDSVLMEPTKQYFENDYMQRTFAGWQDSGAYAEKVWTGVMGYSTDSLPHVGKVPGREGVFVIAGFHGHGMPVIYLAAKGIAAMVTQGTEYDKTGLPSLYKTSKERLASERNDIVKGRYTPLTE